jgi:cold shock protein
MKQNLKTIPIIDRDKAMLKGKVKWYNETKGFGFIQSETGEDVFLHRTSFASSLNGLQPEDEVVFETKMGEKGKVAINVQLAN